ncbi:hypothetical protein EMPS_04404 [Entomortierella parvispora]|uniref:Uncharacterized protein n=1 Tax=Entomortierella parvispora TaxID=205924 RepID=A0A9P3H968_9FUNG|nr:hypothetical protein EMPS_04404 [Entomortierella parvispora]
MLIIKSLLILCSAVAVFAWNSGSSVASGAVFDGEDTTDGSASPVDIFQDPANHASAAASILVFSANSVNFHPSQQSPKSLGSSLGKFVDKVVKFPGFIPTYTDRAFISLDGSLAQFEEVIRESYPGSSDERLVARSLRDLIPGRSTEDDGDDWTLSLVVIDKPEGGDNVEVQLISVVLSIDIDKSGSVSIPKQRAKLNTYILTVNGSLLRKNSIQLSEKVPIVSVPGALGFFASRREELEEAATSCHQESVLFMDQGQRALLNWYNGNY